MVAFIFDFFSSIGHLINAFLEALGSVGRALIDVLFALISVIFWPVKVLANMLLSTLHLSSHWTPLYFLTCGILFFALIVLVAWALRANHLRRKNR